MSDYLSLEDGAAFTATFRQTRDLLIEDGKVTQAFLPLSETFEKGHVETLLGQSGCAGIRAYLGEDNGEMKLILVGVDGNDEDILPTGGEKILDKGIRCPANCPPSSALNS